MGYGLGTGPDGLPAIIAIGPAEPRTFRRLARRLEATERIGFISAPDGAEVRLYTGEGRADEVLIREMMGDSGFAGLATFVMGGVEGQERGEFFLVCASDPESALRIEVPMAVEKTVGSMMPDGEMVEHGERAYCAMTINRWAGTAVVQRFETPEEARAQTARNVAADRPMAGVAME